MAADEQLTIPPKVDDAIMALACTIAPGSNCPDVEEAIRNLVSAVRDQVVEEMQDLLGGKAG